MAKMEAAEKLSSKDQIKQEVQKILGIITSNEFPQMRLKNNGVHREMTEKEFEISARMIYNR